MADKAELLAEAYRRGLLPPDRKAVYEEAQRRGLVPKAETAPRRPQRGGIEEYMRGEMGLGPRRRGGGVEAITGALANVNRGWGFGDELAAAGETLFTAARDGLQGRKTVGWGDRYNTMMAAVRKREDDYMVQHPKAANFLKGTGGAATVLLPGGPVAQLAAKGSLAGNAVRGATVAAAEAAGFGLADRGTMRERVKAATDPVTLAASAALGAAGGALIPRTKAFKPKVRDEAAALVERGVQLTPGQAKGGLAKATEDALTSVPGVGDSIVARRREGIASYNVADLNEALGKIDEALPEGIGAGTAGVKEVGDRLSAAYERTLPEVGVVADDAFVTDLRALAPTMDGLTEGGRKRLGEVLNQRLFGRLQTDGQVLDGAMFKRVDSELEKDAARFTRSTDPDHQAIGDALNQTRKALQAAARRQNPEYADMVGRIDQGWADLTRIEEAATKAVNEGGVYSPAQRTGAMVSGDKRTRVRGRGVARGEARGQDFHVTAQGVLPSKLPDSGTAKRGLIGLALSGGVGATGGVPGLLAGAAASGAGMVAYSRPAMKAYNELLQGQLTKDAERRALMELRNAALQSPEAMKLYQDVLKRFPKLGVGVGLLAGPSASSQ